MNTWESRLFSGMEVFGGNKSKDYIPLKVEARSSMMNGSSNGGESSQPQLLPSDAKSAQQSLLPASQDNMSGVSMGMPNGNVALSSGMQFGPMNGVPQQQVQIPYPQQGFNTSAAPWQLQQQPFNANAMLLPSTQAGMGVGAVPNLYGSTLASATGLASGEKRKADAPVSGPSKSKKTEPSVVSSSCSWSGDNGPPKPKDEAEMAKMTPAERRRYERNLREQQRSYRISQQIKQLRDVLAESNIPFKPNKFSILVCVADYIKQLQARAIMLDAEHQKLIDTITQATELAASGQVPSPSDDPDTSTSSLSGGTENDADMLMVQGINYKSVFEHCPFATGVASLDGRVLACNESLERLFGCEKDEMVEQSLFLYIRNHQELFEAMADLLKRSSVASETGEGTVKHGHLLLYWCGHIISQRAEKVTKVELMFSISDHPVLTNAALLQLQFSITLTSTSDSNPKYFTFSVAPVP